MGLSGAVAVAGRATLAVSGRQAAAGAGGAGWVLSVLHADIQWASLLQELGFGSGMTCWRGLPDWEEEAGVWQPLHEAPLAEANVA